MRDIKLEAEKKRKEEYEHHVLMHDLGKRYLEEVRLQNMQVTPEIREKMDKKRFERMKSMPKQVKSRKYLDDVAREFKDPRDVVFQKDLTKSLKPTLNSDSHNAYIHNLKYFDNRLDAGETKLRYKAGGQEIGLELGDRYISSIQGKLHKLEKEIEKKVGTSDHPAQDAQKPPQENTNQKQTGPKDEPKDKPKDNPKDKDKPKDTAKDKPADDKGKKPAVDDKTAKPAPKDDKAKPADKGDKDKDKDKGQKPKP